MSQKIHPSGVIWVPSSHLMWADHKKKWQQFRPFINLFNFCRKKNNLPWGARRFIDRVTNLLSRAIANFLHRYVTLFYLLGGDAFLKSYLAALLKYVVAYLKLGYFTYTQWNFIFIFLASEGPVHIICFSNWNSSMIHNGVKYSQTWL